jgi:hypothetical protein
MQASLADVGLLAVRRRSAVIHKLEVRLQIRARLMNNRPANRRSLILVVKVSTHAE